MTIAVAIAFVFALGCGGGEDVCSESSDCGAGEACAVNVITGRRACLERCDDDMTCSDGGACIELRSKEVQVEGVVFLCGRP